MNHAQKKEAVTQAALKVGRQLARDLASQGIKPSGYSDQDNIIKHLKIGLNDELARIAAEQVTKPTEG